MTGTTPADETGSNSNTLSLGRKNSNVRNNGGKAFLTKYFLLVLFAFGVLTLMVNSRLAGVVVADVSTLEAYLQDSLSVIASKIREDGIPSSDDHRQVVVGNNQNKRVVNKNNEEGRQRPPKQQPRDDKNYDPMKFESADHRLAGLNCEKYGGPANELAEEMVYWEDIPEDSHHISPFKSQSETQYLTFEPDLGGWNNIRMAMETVMGMAFAMGRTLVLPPSQPMYLLHKNDGKQRNRFSFDHFFHMESISNEHAGLEIISMETFLQREAMTGRLLHHGTGKPSFPPKNRTNWDGASRGEVSELNRWLREVVHVTVWDPDSCLAVFPKSKDPRDVEELKQMKVSVDQGGGFPSYEAYVGKPAPVDAPPIDRMKENWAGRSQLCIYDEHMQSEPVIHFPMSHSGAFKSRLLVHFYAFLFFQDWKEDLWMKRFIRDHVRYIDEIQCAAARVVQAVRQRARTRHPETNPAGLFDTFHIRRGDFQYDVVKVPAEEIERISASQLQPNSTIYVATDEKDLKFFKPLTDKYDIVFLHDFKHELEGVNTNYYGMIDQLVASRGRKFFGCWFSTFTGYINRIRGYHHDDHKAPGYEQGHIDSWYYALRDRYDHMHVFYPVKKSFYAREFPASWRLIDSGIEELAKSNG